MRSWYFITHFQARKDNRRLIRVSMLISVRGIKMSDMETGKTLLNFSIYRWKLGNIEKLSSNIRLKPADAVVNFCLLSKDMYNFWKNYINYMEISIVQKLNLKCFCYCLDIPSLPPSTFPYPGRISYCSADATFTHVFAFIAVNRADCLQCYAFLARKQKIVSQPVKELDPDICFSFSLRRFISGK